MRQPILIAACLATVLTGCSDLSNQVQIDRESGARRGIVTRVIDATVEPGERPICLAELPDATLDQRQYVEVRYRQGPRHYSGLYVGALPPGQRAQVGDAVEFYPKKCSAGEVSIMKRVLPLTQ